MRYLTGFGIGLALVFSTFSSAWADCTFNEAEALNGRITSNVIIAKTSPGWTAEMEEQLDAITNRFDKVADQHNAAESADDQNALNAVCEDYRAILAEIDELSKKLQ